MNKQNKKESIITNKFYKNEEQAVAYANPSLFLYMTKLFLSSNKETFLQHPSLLTDTLTLSVAYSFHLSAFCNKLKERYLQLALELIYFASHNLKTIGLRVIENIANNKFVLYSCESLKNTKKNEKNQES